MSGQKIAGTVFVDDSVDTRAPTRSPDAPVSSRDIIGANWTLTRQDFMGANNQAEMDAYLPIIAELDKNDDRSAAAKIFVPSRYFNVDARGGNNQVNKQTVWESVLARRQSDPNFLKDIPAKNADEFSAWVAKQEQGRHAVASDVVRRESDLGQKALGFGTGVVSSMADPINFGLSLMTMGTAGGAKTLLGSMAREAAINSAIETIELPGIAYNRASFGEQMTPLDMVTDVAAAGAGGALFPVAGRIGHTVASPVLEAAGRAVDPLFDPFRQRAAERALGISDLPGATDADVLRAFTDRVPPAARTPEAQAALNVLGRETEIRDASPYEPSPGGLDAHAEKLGVVADALSQPASVGKAPITPKPQGRSTLPLTQDRIIKFVLNDLEGGATVVPYSQADGGTTKYGVAKKFNPDVDVANITEADAARIARQRYWLPEFNTVDPRVASIAFDANWIRSPTLARRIVREAGDDVSKALDIYRAELMHVADVVPGKAKYRKGWNNRVDKLARFVGDAEASTVKLAPEHFDGDDIAYRAATEDLNREELRLADDTPREPDPVRDYVDRQQMGDDLSTPEAQRFASDNAGAISAELQRRADLGTDGHPDMTAGARVGTGKPSAETALAIREYVRQELGEPSAKNIAADLGVSAGEVRRTLGDAQRRVGQASLTPEWDSDFAHAYALSKAELEHRAATGPFESQVDEGVLTREMASEILREHQPYQDYSTENLANVVQRTLIEQRRPDWIDRVKSGRATPDQQAAFVRLGGAMAALKARNELGGLEDRLLQSLIDRGWSASDAKEVLSGRLADLQGAARRRLPEPAYSEPNAPPPSLDPKAYGVDTLTDPQAKLLADSAYHDVKALANAGDTLRAELVDGGPEMNAKELIESLDKDQSAIDAIRNCL